MHSSLVITTTIIFLLLFLKTLNASEEKLPKSADNSQGWLEDSWPVRFATNCAGYLWVAVPLALVVTLAKRGYLSEGKSACHK